MGAIEISEEPPTREALLQYGKVPIAFRVASRFRVQAFQNGLGGWILTEEAEEHPWVKDYDRHCGEGERPAAWAERFDVSRWSVLFAFDGAELAGGAVVAWNTPGVYMLEGRHDLAVLWDIRVRPDCRRRGVGRLLFAQAAEWAASRRCSRLKIETQNINVPACRFYARMGCELRAIHPDAYPDYPDEVMLLWYRRL